ncbi:uncharacterized protein [Hyperolius riggenbachi]|uniref:uncharacterized protein n=1 Tax=Hyperolius riggenbachi TaxID=752182 RepID=UPI0035A33F16
MASSSSFSMAGCATKNLCGNYNGVTTTTVTGHTAISITCRNATLSTTTPSTSTATSKFLTCISCTNMASFESTCTGTPVTCTGTNDVCTSTYTESKILGPGLTTWTLVRGCGQLSECNQPKTLSNTFMTVSINTSCCTTDNCTPPPSIEPSISTLANGLVCPSCFSLTSYSCVPDSFTQCTGTETECATYSMTKLSVTPGPYLLMMGCATGNLCVNPIGVMSTIITGQIIENITCYNPTGIGKSLSCISCTGTSQSLCTGPSVTCPSTTDVCISSYTETKILAQGITTWTLVRGCGQPTECNQPKTLSNQFMTVSINTGCCTTNDCTPVEPIQPVISSVTNGLVCPSCFSLTSRVCIPDTTTTCTGNEAVCATYSTTNTSVTSGPYLLMMGCASTNLCGNTNGVMSSTIIGDITVNVTCNTTKNQPLTCISCSNTTLTPCTGSSITCPSTTDVCTTTYTVSTLQVLGITSYVQVRGCGPPSVCNQPKTLSNTYITTNINTGCCTTNYCTPQQPAVTANTAVRNGLVCPSCFSLTSSTCVPDAKTACTGNETRCSTYTLTRVSAPTTPYLIITGCATKNLCTNSVGVASTSITGGVITNVTCQNATVCLANSTTVAPTTTTKSPYISCVSCTSPSQTLCTGTSISCPSLNDVCMSTYTETKLLDYGLTSWTLVRGCGLPSQCNQPKSLSNNNVTVDLNTACCSTDNCNPGEPIVPVNSQVRNGLMCPSCFSLASTTCAQQTEVLCTGNETVCTTYELSSISDPTKPFLEMAGCATPNLCVNYDGNTTFSITGQVVANITCHNATVVNSNVLTCISCSTDSQTSCTGSSITCPTGDVCTSTYTRTNILASGQISWTLVRGCGPLAECNQPVTLSNQFTTVSMNTGCCTTDNCTPAEPAVAAISTVTNGLSCPACFSLTSTVCLSDVITQCTGTENVCASYSMRNTSVTLGPYLLMQGCATENVCVANSGIVSTITNGPFSMNITCLNATIIPKNSLTCISCSAASESLCIGTPITCPTGDVCTSTYTKTNILSSGITSWTLVRGCGPSTECNKPVTLSNQFTTVSMNTGCCTTDNCTPAEPAGKYLTSCCILLPLEKVDSNHYCPTFREDPTTSPIHRLNALN